MDRRGFESPMDFEYQNRPPVDPSSPFAKTTPFAKSAHQSSSKPLQRCSRLAENMSTDISVFSLLQLTFEARRRKPKSLCRSCSEELPVQANPRTSPSLPVQPPNTKPAISCRFPKSSIHDAPEAHRRTGIFGVFWRGIQPRLHRQIGYHARNTRRGPGRRLWQDDHHPPHRQQGPVRQERG